MFINDRNRPFAGFGVLGLALSAYLFTNHIHFFTPQLLPLLAIDRAFPLIPGTIWIYQSIFPLIVSSYFLNRGHEATQKFLYSMLLMVAISIGVFLVFPVVYPRDLYPLPESLAGLTRFVFLATRGADTPANCLPSLHVATCYLATLAFLDHSRRKTLIYFFWSNAVVISTLTTKQHYFVDVVGGAALASAVYFLFYRRIILAGAHKRELILKRAA
jgi:membrane-associated phospholipid phosphatase